MSETPLTSAAVLAMAAGPELDAIVADRVLHLKRSVRVAGSDRFVDIYTKNPFFQDGSSHEDYLKRYAGPRGYSTTWERMGELVAAMKAAGWYLILRDGERWLAHWYRMGWRNQVSCHGKTAPEAVAKATVLASMEVVEK